MYFIIKGHDISTTRERAKAVIRFFRSIKSHQAERRPSFFEATSRGHIHPNEMDDSAANAGH